MRKFILDTNIYIKAIRDSEARAELAEWQRARAPFLYQHAVVAAELLAGAADDATWRRWHARWLAPAERVNRIISPTYDCWLRASRVITTLVARSRLTRGSIRPSFFNDCLIASSSAAAGVTVVTDNVRDFKLIAEAESGMRWVGYRERGKRD